MLQLIVASPAMASSQIMQEASVVIIGSGQAASECAAQLRQKGFAGRIDVLGEEPQLPYHRPPLSKGFLRGDLTADALHIRSAATYERLGVRVRTNMRVDSIDRNKRTVSCTNETIGYSWLVIATGGRARTLRVPGAELNNIHYVRTMADVEKLHPMFQADKRLTIVGGGYVGLEIAAIAAARGLLVTVLEGAPRVLARVTAPAMSMFYEEAHRAAGVKIRTGVAVSGFDATAGTTDVGTVAYGEGERHPADIVIVGIGMIPNAELAEEAGLVVDGGIVVDAECRTTNPHIFAIGDCAVHAHHGFLERKVRLESVPNAMETARAAACAITGQAIPPALAPWFWSDQYKLKLQMVGLSEGYDGVVVRGSPDTQSFIAFYLKDSVMIAADAVNRAADFMAAKRLVGERRVCATMPLSDESVPLMTMLSKGA